MRNIYMILSVFVLSFAISIYYIYNTVLNDIALAIYMSTSISITMTILFFKLAKRPISITTNILSGVKACRLLSYVIIFLPMFYLFDFLQSENATYLIRLLMVFSPFSVYLLQELSWSSQCDLKAQE